MTALIAWGPAMMVALTVVLGMIYQTHHFDKRFEDLRSGFDRRFEAFDKRFEDLRSGFDNRFEDCATSSGQR